MAIASEKTTILYFLARTERWRKRKFPGKRFRKISRHIRKGLPFRRIFFSRITFTSECKQRQQRISIFIFDMQQHYHGVERVSLEYTVNKWHCQTSWPPLRKSKRQRDLADTETKGRKHVIWIFVPLSPCKYGMTSERARAADPPVKMETNGEIYILSDEGVNEKGQAFALAFYMHVLRTSRPQIRGNLSLDVAKTHVP